MRKRLRKDDSADVNMTPMLDIVFILLIFFIVTATFLQEKGIQMLAPPNDEQQTNQQSAPSILVRVDENNRIQITGKGGQTLEVDIERVTANIQRQIVELGGKGAVIIIPHVDSEHGAVTDVYDSAITAKAVAVVVRKPEDF